MLILCNKYKECKYKHLCGWKYPVNPKHLYTGTTPILEDFKTGVFCSIYNSNVTINEENFKNVSNM